MTLPLSDRRLYVNAGRVGGEGGGDVARQRRPGRGMGVVVGEHFPALRGC